MNLTKLRAAALACCISMLAACAGAPQTVDLPREARASIRSIAIVVPPEPRSYSVVNMGNPALAFALVGGIFVAADQDQKQAKLYRAMQFEKFSVKAVLAGVLQSKLAAAGYETKLVEGAWEQREGRQYLRTDLASAGADAILVVVPVTAGFVATGPASDYVPSLTVLARVLSSDGRTELYRAFHAYGWQRPHTDGWRFTPAARGFNDFEALMAKPAASAAALAESAGAVASTIAADLGRP